MDALQRTAIFLNGEPAESVINLDVLTAFYPRKPPQSPFRAVPGSEFHLYGDRLG